MHYRVRYVHKVSQVCTCGHTQYQHGRPVPAETARYPGELKYGEGPCMPSCAKRCQDFEPGNVESFDLPQGLPGSLSVVAKVLRDAHVLGAGTRLRELRREADGSIVCFPMASSWHALICTPVGAPGAPASEAPVIS